MQARATLPDTHRSAEFQTCCALGQSRYHF